MCRVELGTLSYRIVVELGTLSYKIVAELGTLSYKTVAAAIVKGMVVAGGRAQRVRMAPTLLAAVVKLVLVQW